MMVTFTQTTWILSREVNNPLNDKAPYSEDLEAMLNRQSISQRKIRKSKSSR